MPSGGEGRPFSAATRLANWNVLHRERADVLVVGGGVTGTGIARDAAERGLRVVLAEAGDFGEGTSSRSSRLVHGGIRYLETGDLPLVWEASTERRRLLRTAGHLVRPLPFLFPVYRGEPGGYRKLQAGMWLYDALAMFRNIRRHRMLNAEAVLRREPRLRSDGLRGAALYFDAAVDDARLALATARAAHRAGATIISHARVTSFSRGPSGVTGTRLLRSDGARTEVKARAIVNATGPWSDRLRQLADPRAISRLRLTKGVHIMLRRHRVRNRHAVVFRSPVDGRVMFVLPWQQHAYVGTTDTDFTGDPANAKADPADIDYLLRSANEIFPKTELTRDDVISTWAGIRPLVAPEAADVGESGTSREHAIWRDASGLFSVAGGKLTTYRVMAAETVNMVANFLRREAGMTIGRSRTARRPLPGAPTESWTSLRCRVRLEAGHVGLTEATADCLARCHGTEAKRLLDLVRAHPDLGRPLVPGHPYIRAQIRYAVQREMALTLEDLLRRRTNVLQEAEDGGLRVAESVAREASAAGLHWTDAEVKTQVEGYRKAVKRSRGACEPA